MCYDLAHIECLMSKKLLTRYFCSITRLQALPSCHSTSIQTIRQDCYWYNYTCHYFLSQIENNRTTDGLDVRQVLMDMRSYRMGLIQTPDQLRFSYLAIIEGAKRVLSRSPDSGFEVKQLVKSLLNLVESSTTLL